MPHPTWVPHAYDHQNRERTPRARGVAGLFRGLAARAGLGARYLPDTYGYRGVRGDLGYNVAWRSGGGTSLGRRGQYGGILPESERPRIVLPDPWELP